MIINHKRDDKHRDEASVASEGAGVANADLNPYLLIEQHTSAVAGSIKSQLRMNANQTGVPHISRFLRDVGGTSIVRKRLRPAASSPDETIRSAYGSRRTGSGSQ